MLFVIDDPGDFGRIETVFVDQDAACPRAGLTE